MTATSSNELFQVKIGNYLSYTTYFRSKNNLQLEFYIQEKSEPIKIPKTYVYKYNVCFPTLEIKGRQINDRFEDCILKKLKRF